MSGANAVREDRLWQRHADMAKLGGTPRGGVNRQALSAEDAAARNLLAGWARARGFSLSTDAIGNLFVRREGTDATATPVMSGSHRDSLPTGGRFDGMYGVVAAFEALEALEDSGVKTKRPVVAVAWTNEEGSRFQPGAMGSAVFAGHNRLDEMLLVKDWKGVVLKDALAETLKAAPAPLRDGKPGFALDGYVEAHIEQGPVLEAENLPIGVVTGIAAQLRLKARFTGEAGHAGTTPMRLRRDAVAAAAQAILAVERVCAGGQSDLVGTVGRIITSTSAFNVIAGEAEIGIDVRAGLRSVRDAAAKEIREQLEAIAATRRVGLDFSVVQDLPGCPCDPHLMDLMDQAVEAVGVTPFRLMSGAGHDAMAVVRLAPVAMLFIRCERGLSHNAAEKVAEGDVAVAARALVAFVERLAEAPLIANTPSAAPGAAQA